MSAATVMSDRAWIHSITTDDNSGDQIFVRTTLNERNGPLAALAAVEALDEAGSMVQQGRVEPEPDVGEWAGIADRLVALLNQRELGSDPEESSDA